MSILSARWGKRGTFFPHEEKPRKFLKRKTKKMRFIRRNKTKDERVMIITRSAMCVTWPGAKQRALFPVSSAANGNRVLHLWRKRQVAECEERPPQWQTPPHKKSYVSKHARQAKNLGTATFYRYNAETAAHPAPPLHTAGIYKKNFREKQNKNKTAQSNEHRSR